MNVYAFDQPLVSLLSTLPILCGILAMLSPIVIPNKIANQTGGRFAKLVEQMALITLLFAIISTGAYVASFLGEPNILRFKSFGITVYLDALTEIIFLLVAFLATVVARYSRTYLSGDTQQGYFSKWLSITVGSVLTLIVSGNLLMFTVAWMMTSMSLHKLLTFYGNRRAARLAAFKKFAISRLGDLCLLGALIFTWKCFGTWQFDEMFSKLELLHTLDDTQKSFLEWSSILLAAGALLKSAQFPFHSWLPDTMETPTPVSALMHAGIVNAGGFLIVRLSPILTTSSVALSLLTWIGAFTALFASVVMLTQTSVKRSLAYSTIAQMGFMMLQCGLGAFALAVLHIVAHSLYKAHAFLSSGSIVKISKSTWVPSERPSAHPIVLVVTLLTAVGLTISTGMLFGSTVEKQPALLLLGSVFMMALAYFLWNLWASGRSSSLFGWGLLIGSVVGTAYFATHRLFEMLLAGSLPNYVFTPSTLEYGTMASVVLLFMTILIFQSQLPSLSATRLGRALYVHASNGFYIGTIANRLLYALLKRLTANTIRSNNSYEPNLRNEHEDTRYLA